MTGPRAPMTCPVAAGVRTLAGSVFRVNTYTEDIRGRRRGFRYAVFVVAWFGRRAEESGGCPPLRRRRAPELVSRQHSDRLQIRPAVATRRGTSSSCGASCRTADSGIFAALDAAGAPRGTGSREPVTLGAHPAGRRRGRRRPSSRGTAQERSRPSAMTRPARAAVPSSGSTPTPVARNPRPPWRPTRRAT
jgi:hypothetical protein